MQKVAFTPFSLRTWRTCGVHVRAGPSSIVMLTPLGPLSDAWAISMLTSGAGSLGSGRDVWSEIGLGLAGAAGPSSAGTDCEVNAAAVAVTAATTIAAASTRPFVACVPLRLMSAPSIHTAKTRFPTREDGAGAEKDPAVTDRAQFRRVVAERRPVRERRTGWGSGREDVGQWGDVSLPGNRVCEASRAVAGHDRAAADLALGTPRRELLPPGSRLSGITPAAPLSRPRRCRCAPRRARGPRRDRR